MNNHRSKHRPVIVRCRWGKNRSAALACVLYSLYNECSWRSAVTCLQLFLSLRLRSHFFDFMRSKLRWNLVCYSLRCTKFRNYETHLWHRALRMSGHSRHLSLHWWDSHIWQRVARFHKMFHVPNFVRYLRSISTPAGRNSGEGMGLGLANICHGIATKSKNKKSRWPGARRPADSCLQLLTWLEDAAWTRRKICIRIV